MGDTTHTHKLDCIRIPARCITDGIDSIHPDGTGLITKVTPGPGKSLRIYIDGYTTPSIEHMDNLVHVYRPHA